ncbi:MAG: tetratricopeptide repeat protein [Proteobacteria bacterium]|nr:tetratricopeptide repeat protein [Pseudomonadota bacterium]
MILLPRLPTTTLRLVVFLLVASTISCESINPSFFMAQQFFDGRLKKADELAQKGLYREAIAAYKELLNSRADQRIIHRNLGVVLTQIGLYHQAEEHLLQAVRALPNNYQARYYLAEVQRVLKKWSSSIHHYRAALNERPLDLKASRGLAWNYYNLSEYPRSLAIIRQLPPGKQNDPQVMIIRARLHIQLNNHGSALAILNSRRWQNFPFYTPYRQSLLGDIYYMRKNWGKASHHYNQALKLNPHLPSALVGSAKVSYEQGGKKKAKELLLRALQIKGDLSEPYFYLAKILQPSHPKKSLEYYKKFADLAESKTRFAYMMDDVKNNINYLENTLQQTHRVYSKN